MATWIGHQYSNYTVGQTGFLLESHNLNNGSDEEYNLVQHPGCTNMSGQARLNGWLGTTDNVYRAARGMARVARVARNGRALVVGLTPEEQTAALEELGYPELEE